MAKITERIFHSLTARRVRVEMEEVRRRGAECARIENAATLWIDAVSEVEVG